MNIKYGEHYTEFNGKDHQGRFSLQIQNDLTQIRFTSGIDKWNDSAAYDCCESELELIRDMITELLNNNKTHKIEGLGSTTLTNPPKQDIPEWLQREMVRFWGNAFITSKGQTTFDCSNYADKCLEKFDKRFLNQKDYICNYTVLE